MENLSLLRMFWIMRFCCDFFGEVVLPYNTNCFTLKRRFSIVEINSGLQLLLKTNQMFRVRSVASLAAIYYRPRFERIGQPWEVGAITTAWNLEMHTKICLELVWVSCCLNFWSQKNNRSHWSSDCHMQTVRSLGATDLAQETLSCQVLRCVWQSAHWVNVVGVVIRDQAVDFPQIHR